MKIKKGRFGKAGQPLKKISNVMKITSKNEVLAVFFVTIPQKREIESKFVYNNVFGLGYGS